MKSIIMIFKLYLNNERIISIPKTNCLNILKLTIVSRTLDSGCSFNAVICTHQLSQIYDKTVIYFANL